MNEEDQKEVSKLSKQGSAYKKWFFVSLAFICVLRAVSLLMLGIFFTSWHMMMTSVILIDLPSLMLLTAFSFFAYYLYKLNEMIERVVKIESHNSIIPSRRFLYNRENPDAGHARY